MQQTQLKTAQLGRTGLEITRVGFGAWAIGGGGWEFGWGPQEDEESIQTIHRALELGVNWIDTAAAYGFGHSETVVGRGRRTVSARPGRGHQRRPEQTDSAVAHLPPHILSLSSRSEEGLASV